MKRRPIREQSPGGPGPAGTSANGSMEAKKGVQSAGCTSPKGRAEACDTFLDAVAAGMLRWNHCLLLNVRMTSACAAPPGTVSPGGTIMLSVFGHFFTDNVQASRVCSPAMNNRDLWLRTIAVASDPSDESAWVHVDAPASLLSRGPVRSHGCTVPRHCAAVVSSG